ncbi:MAG: tRNA guanosine(34) transglycosylase Tgt [Bacillota bacterium]|nr:MAG: tRNA guanosine(34) transglycosylase Tgt [Bacillota bacterium]
MRFRLDSDQGSPVRERAGVLETAHGQVKTPVFMPVGTQGSVKGVAPRELRETGTQIVLANTYHLHLRPGESTVAQMGGLHSFMGWDGPILTDSGGYQVFSLARLRKVSDEGVTFRSHIDGSEHFLSPEAVIRIQQALGSDVMMVLDECPPSDTDRPGIERAVRRTAHWASRCRQEAGLLPEGRGLFGIVQGGVFPDLRRESARLTVDIGFDGYAIGGLGLGEDRAEMLSAVEAVTSSVPEDKPLYFMGLGTPAEILAVVARGVDMFDCVLPTRLGRHGTVMTRLGNVVVRNAAYAGDDGPLEEGCDCYACRGFSRAYIRHLISAGEILGLVLCTHHNLRFLHRLTMEAREAILAGDYREWMNDVLARLRRGGVRSTR